MSNQKLVYVVGGDPLVKQMFWDRGWGVVDEESMVVEGTPDQPIDLVCFTGGADVSPSLYGEENTSSYCDPRRDEFEVMVYEEFLSSSLPVSFVGICRGGQFLNVMNGGKLIQHLGRTVSGIVVCKDQDGESYYTHVDHHQGIVRNTEASESILAFDAGEVHPQGPGVGITYACYYPETRSLCFQPHPEWGHEPTKDLFFSLLEEYT